MENDAYLKRLQASVDFIEANLREDLPLKEISRQANASLFHFHRLFRAFTGYSLKEYIRNRRLSSAAGELVGTRKTVLDIALDHRYSTPESFQRAFKAAYGITPRDFRKRGVFSVVHEKADLFAEAMNKLKKETCMEPHIVVREPFRLIGTLIRTRHGICHDDIAAFRKRMRKNVGSERKPGESDADSLYGVCFGFCDGCRSSGSDPGRFTYIIGREAETDEAPRGDAASMDIPGGTYAVFPVKGGEKELENGMNGIYASWLPSSGYELSDSPILEKYPDGRIGGNGSSMEIWLPVRRKEE